MAGKILIGNIEVLYDEYDGVGIERIRGIINNNPSLLADKSTVHINDFDDYFKRVSTLIFANNSELFSNPDLLPGLYITSLVKNNPDYKDAIVKLDVECSNDMLYTLIAYKYYGENGSLADLIEYLMYRKDTDKIMEWLYTQHRWDTYNYLLEVIVNCLKNFDFKLLDVMPDMVNSFLMSALKTRFSNENNKVELPLLSHDELDTLFCKFLSSIKAPKEWLDMYEELKSSDRIVFVEPGLFDSECVEGDDGVLRLIIEDYGTVDTFYTLVHEFSHYVSRKRLGIVPFSLLEFPCIFFEKLASRFLEGEGYSNDVVNAVIKMRNENNSKIYLDLLPVFNAVNGYVKRGCCPVLREDMVKSGEEQFRIIRETKEKLENLTGEDFGSSEISNIDIEAMVDSDCDSLIRNLIQNGLLVIDGCQYIVGTYLADGVLSKVDSNPEVVQQMLKVTENLVDTNLENVLVLFDMQDLFSHNVVESKVNIK